MMLYIKNYILTLSFLFAINFQLLEANSVRDYCMPLHYGANLISFYLLPEDLSIESVMQSVEGVATGVIGEGVASTYIEGYGWAGSLSSIKAESGYWVQVEQGTDLCFEEAFPTSPSTRYNLHFGSNLVSFPAHSTIPLGDALEDEVELLIDGIITEGAAAVYIDGSGWHGSLSSFKGGRGYWINAREPFMLIFETNLY